MAGNRQRRNLEVHRDHPSPDLPSEIIFSHILSKLPPKALLRCKCVCKFWSSRIHTTDFLFQTEDGLFSSKLIEHQDNPTPLAKLSRHKGFIFSNGQCVNGLVFLDHYKPFIFNPSTRELIKLPHTVKSCHNQSCLTYHYFGFCPLTNQYKVLQFIMFYPQGGGNKWDIVLNTFTLGTDSWRKLQVHLGDPPFDDLNCESRSTRSVCLDGAIHWMFEGQKYIVVFDVGAETFRSIPLPHDYAEEFDDYPAEDNDDFYDRGADCLKTASLVEVGGCLGVFVDKSWRQGKVVLWILKDYQKYVWVKETISLFPREARYQFDNGCYVEALGTIHTGELALVFYLLGCSPDYDDDLPQLYLYDMKSKGYRRLDFVLPKSFDPFDNRPIKLITIYDNCMVPFK